MNFEDYQPYLSPALAKATDLIAVSGKGCYLTDSKGDRYLDFVQGIAVNALGHCHPKIVEAIKAQAEKLITASFNVVNYPATLELARRLAGVTPGELDSVFFSNGGAEAVDGALKLAKVYTRRPAIIAFQGSFHGRSFGALSVTGSNANYRKYYEPLVGSVYFTAYPSKDLCPKGFNEEQRTKFCLSELDRLFENLVAPDQVAAIIMEPVQGEGGYVVPSRAFVQEIRERCDRYGILLILDEIQSGYGRTGKMFASSYFDVVPDIMTIGKAIAGGLPMSAVISTAAIMKEWHPGMHGTTFGGNPICAASALAVLDEFKQSALLKHVNEAGTYLKSQLVGLQKKYNCISDVRGLGLMLAIEFSHPDGSPAGDLLEAVRTGCLKNKLLTLSCGVHHNGMRFATPLNVTRDEIDQGITIIDSVMNRLCVQ
ncbi:aspartate aminotransferase family protein [Sporolactobacillus shoreicorticis]|uniref:Aspartate aminotransferase family protein n=1 Tax=Sporolactobacillus shoreicorticis TaxID=1923877 RepID=A0ABW5S344_9BACL|nr:aspartate aminotransferase family protein [Sporolactobacillus shoreicorticis]MCO7124274.1 aspartate aminotransferase family protein [Sporolactobacillus shoreicorticis]